jgi:hypothetical protein
MDNNKKIYLTKEGLSELKKEYDELVNVKRPDVWRVLLRLEIWEICRKMRNMLQRGKSSLS